MPAGQLVGSLLAGEEVDPVAPVDAVVPRAAADEVVAPAGIDAVVARRADDDVVAVRADDVPLVPKMVAGRSKQVGGSAAAAGRPGSATGAASRTRATRPAGRRISGTPGNGSDGHQSIGTDRTAAPPEAATTANAESRRSDDPRPSCSVELRGLEPLTPCMPCRCATSCATAPKSPASSAGNLRNPNQLLRGMRNRVSTSSTTERQAARPANSGRQVVRRQPRLFAVGDLLHYGAGAVRQTLQSSSSSNRPAEHRDHRDP